MKDEDKDVYGFFVVFVKGFQLFASFQSAHTHTNKRGRISQKERKKKVMRPTNGRGYENQ